MSFPARIAWPVVDILRWSEAGEGTVGSLLVNRVAVCLTLEPNDRDDNLEGGNSCIEAQEYRCHLRQTDNHGETYEVLGVPGRSAVLFHTGNRDVDSRGCILTVTTIGDDEEGHQFLGASRVAYRRFRAALMAANHGTLPEDFTLRIVKGY